MQYKVPLFDLNFGPDEEEAVLETIRSKWISMGPKTMEFENKFASALGAEYAVGLSNCTVALHLALKILDIKEGDEVIVPSLTFVATVNSVRYVNAIPVFCDIKSTEDLTLDPDKVEKLINRKTRAIIVMHYAGFPCDMSRIMEIARKNKIRVIEDACHAPLSELDGKKLGTFGDVGCFSFFSNKNISTGEGGMLVVKDQKHFERAKLLRSHGMTTLSYERAKGHSSSYDVVDLGYNYRLDDIRSSIGIVQLDKLRDDLIKRKEVRSYYISVLSEIKDIIIPFRDKSGFVSNYIFPIVLQNESANERDRVRSELHFQGIQTSVHYPAVHRFSIYSDCTCDLPVTNFVTDAEITLPMHSKLTVEDIDYIAQKLIECL